MPRVASGLLVGVLSLWASAAAQANWFKTIYHDVRGGFHTNNMWPEPYVEPSRRAVKEPFAILHARGWQRQNLLGEHHFEEDQTRLTPAGVLRVKAMLANSPPQYRAVFVEKGQNREVTNSRIDAIQQAIVDMQIEGPLPAVTASDLIVEGWSSEYVDAVGRKYHLSIPEPRLPAATGASASGP
ncbi:MAG: hypothetical protein WD894_01620 [Pirellulales bacterium]